MYGAYSNKDFFPLFSTPALPRGLPSQISVLDLVHLIHPSHFPPFFVTESYELLSVWQNYDVIWKNLPGQTDRFLAVL